MGKRSKDGNRVVPKKFYVTPEESAMLDTVMEHTRGSFSDYVCNIVLPYAEKDLQDKLARSMLRFRTDEVRALLKASASLEAAPPVVEKAARKKSRT